MPAQFYPLFTTSQANGQCVWHLGGANLPNTTNTFGGTSTAEFGNLLQVTYPYYNSTIPIFSDYRQVLANNPCPALVTTTPPTPTVTPTATATPVTPTPTPARIYLPIVPNRASGF